MELFRIIRERMMRRVILFLIGFTVLLFPQELRKEVDQYLESYNKTYRELYTAASEAEWRLNTYIVEGDTESQKRAQEAHGKMAEFTGSVDNIETATNYLERKDELTPLQVKQLETILYMAGGSPQTIKEVVDETIKVNTEQVEKLFGFTFKVEEKELTPNEIDALLIESTDLKERRRVWESSKEVGKVLKPGMVRLQELRNKSVQALGYSDYFAYQVSDYGMEVDEMMQLTRKMIRELYPLYRELHTWARYTLAEKYGESVPDMLPAHWLPNRWGQEWSGMVSVEGLDLDGALSSKSAEWIMEKGEEFYVSMGFDPLPKTFYELSSLYPLPKDAEFKKNTHASAWHVDRDKDVRSLMSVEPNTRWWGTVLHELGHVYYFMEYSTPEVPYILREGANRAYHEAVGSLIGLAAMQKPFLSNLGLVNGGGEETNIDALLQEALDHVVFIPWGAGVMTEFEYELYSNNLSPDQYNSKWWELKRKYQGIVPPADRGEEFNDAASKTHITDDPAQYYDYPLSTILLFQLHDHIAKNILHQNPHATNYWGSKETGDFLKKILRPGATVDWREHLRESIGSDISAKPMLDYFAPLMEHLRKVNKGRNYTLPENF
jgi:peptidyl-dipeptidase A